MNRTIATLCTVLVLCGTLAAAKKPKDPKLARLDALLQKVQTDPAGTKEAEVKELLALAQTLGRPYSASLSIRGYLSHHFKPSPELLLATADAAYNAGDYTFAVARYKAYLAAAEPSKQAGRAAGTLYGLLVDFLAAEEDAYQFMRQHGHKFRKEPPARRFDSWFLTRARTKSDYPAVARTLSLAMADKLPLPQEKAYYWESLDWLMDRISRATPEQFAALPFCRKVVPLIRGDKRRRLRSALLVANLGFKAGAAGKDDEALDRDFELVARAAMDYVSALPTAETLQETLRAMAGGIDRFDHNAWQGQVDQKREFFAAAFEKLPDAEKTAMLSWDDRHNRVAMLATPQQWAQIGAKNAKLFSGNPAARNVPLPLEGEKRADYAKLAVFCKGIPSEDAAVICALAASDDLKQVIDHLMRNDSWHLRLDRYHTVLGQKLFPAYRRIHETKEKPLPQRVIDEALLHFGTRYLAQSPIAVYCPDAVRDYVSAVWRSSGEDRYDKGQVAKHLKAVAWAPFETGSRKRQEVVYSWLNSEARRWADDLRADARRKPKERKADPAYLKQIAPVQEAIRAARTADASKAPNALCKAVAEMVLAARQRDEAKRTAAERRAYALVKSYDTAHTPYGRYVFARIIPSRGRQFANLDLQLEMLTDQLERFRPDQADEPVELLMTAIFSDRGDWSLGGSSSRYKSQCLRINAVLAKTVARLADRGQFSATLFDWFRRSRYGRSWSATTAGQDVMTKVIDRRLFHKSGYRVDSGSLGATTSYMRLIRDEFPSLNAKYPVETWFDDMFVEEATAKGFLDWSYWDLGRDEKKKVVNAAAKLLARDPLPIGPDDAEGVYSVRTLNRWMNVALKADEAARKKLTAAADAAYGKSRFDAYAMGYGFFSMEAAADPKNRQAFFRKLDTYVKRSAAAPARLSVPALPLLEKIDAKDLTDAELGILIRVFADAPSPYWPKGWQFDKAVGHVHAALTARGRHAELFPLVGHFWKAARDLGDYHFWKDLTARADDLRKAGERDLALAYSTVGLTLVGDRLSSDFRSALGSVRTWALTQMGGIIPVAKGHPLRALYEAQLAYLTGKEQTAWETYLANRARLAKSYREFDPQFCIWAIRKENEFRNFDQAEALAREMITWFDEVSERFDAEVRARLQLTYADIALARDDRPRARALYERIAANSNFAGTRAQLDAELKIADVDAKDGNFDRAIERLEDLSRRQDRYLQTEAAFHIALVRYAQEDYAEAKDHLEAVFTLSPDHAEGRILEGRVNLKLKKLEQPTDIDLGEKIGKKFIVPGRPVRVTLMDRNLSIVRKATEIEIRVWTDSGDEEFFALTPFGDSKVKFKGQIDTALGAVKKHDHTIQVIGKDQVHYAFSDRFAKAQKIESNEPFTLQVATDAELYASSGRILTRQEREARALEEMIRKRMGTDVDDGTAVPLSTVRAEDQIKPGNKVNLRVIDPDRGQTRQKDTLTVRLATTSGDSIDRFTLTETDPHSGVFEGAVPTEPAQATAVASDSQEGAEANFAISSKNYPAWVGLPKPTRSRPKTFSVDLNDNVPLGTMNVRAAEEGRKLKSFLVQTSFNGRDFTTVGAWPKPFVPWDGKPTVEFARYVSEDSSRRGQLAGPRTIQEFQEYLEQGCLREGQKKVARPLRTLAAQWDWKLGDAGREIGLDNNKSSDKYYVAHLQAAFHQPRRQIRSFILRPNVAENAKKADATYLIAIDGDVTSEYQAVTKDEPFSVGIKRALAKGVHRIDVYVFAHQRANSQFEVLCDTDKPPYVIPCPADMIDPAKQPEIAKGLQRPVAEIKADADATAFDVAFPTGARARVIRLLLTDFESDAPAINKIRLSDAAGKQVLPTQHDFMALRKNQVLEIVPGDRLTVTYEDPKVLTQGKELHEAFLTATYTNATVSACFVEFTMRNDGERDARYIPMRRFNAGDKINVFIQDPDGDVSDKLDTLKFTARTTDGKPVDLTALETEEHSGVFLGVLFPIRGKPERKSELTVREGDDIVLNYTDRENTDPGIPWDRTFAVEQVWFEQPQVRVYEVSSLTLDEADKLAGRKSPSAGRKAAPKRPGRSVAPTTAQETVPARRTLLAVRPEQPVQPKPAGVVIGGPLLVEVLFPYITKSAESQCTLYAQTSSGRKKLGKPIGAGGFDPNAPGTILLTRTPGDAAAPPAAPGYREVIVRTNPYALPPLDDGRFTFSVPLKLGAVPDKTLIHADPQAGADDEEAEEVALAVNSEDTVYLGLKYTDEQGKNHWAVREATLSADFFFDTMDRRYQEEVDGLYVGENLYFRVIDATRDRADEKDLIQLEIARKDGKTKKVELVETFSHSGVFKGLVKVVHADDKAAGAEPGTVAAVYGDSLTARYVQPKTKQSAEAALAVYKGADGKVVPFTKRFKDPAIAVETQFMVAEAYFELAKRHRQLGQGDLAREEIAQGRKLLEEAIRDYPNTTARAQAEYLLADLSLEFGNDANDVDVKKKHYMDAIARYSDIVATYPDSEYAPKAQFRKALSYEKMEMLDEACEEYVKLSYRYPDNPLVAETIARLGQYFLDKGRGIRKASEEIEDAVEREKKRLEAVEMFKTAGEVFARLSVRFPNHRLAGKTMLLSAQCFMQAEDYGGAVKGYTRVIRAPDMDKDLVAEAMYWCGHSYMEIKDLVKAYQSFKKLTWDYPATKWAKFARGRLADEALQNIEE